MISIRINKTKINDFKLFNSSFVPIKKIKFTSNNKMKGNILIENVIGSTCFVLNYF